MIDPAGIPVIAGNMDALAGHATAISDTGRAFADTGAAIHNTWQGLYPHYIAPESGQLLSATGIIATTTASVGEDLGTAGTALTTYADEVRVIQAALVALQDQAKTLVADRTAAGDDWASDSALVERDTALIDAVNAQVAAFTDAERRCANALRVLYGAPLLSVDNGDGVLDPATEYGVTAEQLDAAARNGGTPWGATSEVDHAWPIDVLHGVGSFFGGLYQSGEGAVVGIGTLLGFSGGENAGAAWGALGTLATGALVYGLVGIEEAERLDHNGSIPWLAPGAMGQSLEDAGKAFIAYDQWDDDPARAAGATLGNVILTVVGPKAVGGVTRSTGAALGRIPGPVAARTSQALINAGTTIGRTPTLTDISRYARNTFPGFRSPDVRTPPIVPMPDSPSLRTVSPEAEVVAPASAADTPRAPSSPALPDTRVSPDLVDAPVVDRGSTGPRDPGPADSIEPNARPMHGEGPDVTDPPLPDAAGRPRNWEHLPQSTQAVSEPAIHADSVPAHVAEIYLKDRFPQIPGTNAERFSSGQQAYRQNCTHCVVTVDHQLDGHWAMASPRPVLDGSLRAMLNALPPSQRSVHSSYDSVIRRMSTLGSDGRAVVHIERPDGSAHVFNAINTSDGVVFLDGQVGRLADLETNVSRIMLYSYRQS